MNLIMTRMDTHIQAHLHITLPPTYALLLHSLHPTSFTLHRQIGEQNERAYPFPAFLASPGDLGTTEGGRGVRQLLIGCLQPSSGRVSAKDLAYLAAISETTSSDQRSRIMKQLGCKYTCNVCIYAYVHFYMYV